VAGMAKRFNIMAIRRVFFFVLIVVNPFIIFLCCFLLFQITNVE